ncbi:MAG TPA: methionyl-tRNA formyltransferase [Candidatus Moranbacteria bacterium]|nr:methionyl-tRNA formyltransferase [Candidatus Moranbacteria bacterium]
MNKDPLKISIVFMGTSSFAETILRSLVSSKYNVKAVYTQGDKKTGRNQEIGQSPVKITAEGYKIPVLEPKNFDEIATAELESLNPDLIIVAAYGKILPRKILEIPQFGSINVHASILPKFRGPSPIQNALLYGEKETGVTFMLMDEGIDTGDILFQEEIKIGKDDTYPELSQKLAEASSRLILEVIPQWIEKKIKPQSQDNSKATICQLIERQDGKVNWDSEAQEIYNRYRAFYPWPGIYTFWKRKDSYLRLKLNKISHIASNPESKHHLGEVFSVSDKIGVQTAEGLIIIEELQMEGKPNSKVNDFINGYSDFVGALLK